MHFRFIEGSYRSEYENTIGAAFCSKRLNVQNRTVSLVILMTEHYNINITSILVLEINKTINYNKIVYGTVAGYCNKNNFISFY